MKQGKTLSELALEIERQSTEKNDYIAPSNQIVMTESGKINIPCNESSSATSHFHNQLSTFTGIGNRYYQRMLEDDPRLLAKNVNHWMQHGNYEEKRRMIRELDGNYRAFMSDRYLRLDNDLVMNQALQVMSGHSGIKIASCEVTENRLYIKAVLPRLEKAVKVNDPVQMGIVISNSEIGGGSFKIAPLIFRLICTNGMVSGKEEAGLNRRHLGKRVDSSNIIYSQETVEAMAKVTLSEANDAMNTFLHPDYFQRIVEKMQDATSSDKVKNPEKAVEKLAKTFSLTDGLRSDVLENFIRDQDYSLYGMMNAVTETANKHESYDTASNIEEIGGMILDMQPNQWRTIAETA